MKKIAILATYVGVINRGAETFVIELADKLRHKYNVTVYSMGEGTRIAPIIRQVKVKKRWYMRMLELFMQCRVGEKLLYRSYWLLPTELLQRAFNKAVYGKYLQHEHYDLIFVNNGYWGTHYARKVRDMNGTPFVVTAHGGYEPKLWLEEPDCYVALANEWKEKVKEKYDKVVEIMNGVDTTKFIEDDDYIPNVKKRNIVLLVANLSRYKRHHLAIDAVALLDNVKLVCIGGGALFDEVKSYGKTKLGDRFEIKKVPYDEMKHIYHEANVFTLPSYQETCSIAYFEALASNLPVVAPDDSVRREQIGEAGILCDCTDAKTYAMAISEALARDWGDLPRQQALKYDWNVVAERYAELFERVMK